LPFYINQKTVWKKRNNRPFSLQKTQPFVLLLGAKVRSVLKKF